MQSGREASPWKMTTMRLSTSARNNQLNPLWYQHAGSVTTPQRLQGWYRELWGMEACGTEVHYFLISQLTSTGCEAKPSPLAERCSTGWWSWHSGTLLLSYPIQPSPNPFPHLIPRRSRTNIRALAHIHNVSLALSCNIPNYQKRKRSLPQIQLIHFPGAGVAKPWGYPIPGTRGESSRGTEGWDPTAAP